MKSYKAPNGKPITSVLETILCRAHINGISEDGACVQYAGSTDVFWDEQKPVLKEGNLLFLDEDGEEWTFDQLVIDEDVAEE